MQVEFTNASADSLIALDTTFSVACPDDTDEDGFTDEFVYSLYYAVGGERKVYVGHAFDPADFAADSFYLPPGLGPCISSILEILWILYPFQYHPAHICFYLRRSRQVYGL